MIALFERAWETAKPLDETVGGRGEELTAREREVLRAMCEVAKDQAGAARVGVSLRTYRRCLATVLERLGASNRVEGALIARDRGWI